MTDTVMLRAAISRSGISIVFLAGNLGISRECFYNKLNNESEFKASEIVCLTRTLRLTQQERDAIFFAEDSESNSHLLEGATQ